MFPTSGTQTTRCGQRHGAHPGAGWVDNYPIVWVVPLGYCSVGGGIAVEPGIRKKNTAVNSSYNVYRHRSNGNTNGRYLGSLGQVTPSYRLLQCLYCMYAYCGAVQHNRCTVASPYSINSSIRHAVLLYLYCSTCKFCNQIRIYFLFVSHTFVLRF